MVFLLFSSHVCCTPLFLSLSVFGLLYVLRHRFVFSCDFKINAQLTLTLICDCMVSDLHH